MVERAKSEIKIFSGEEIDDVEVEGRLKLHEGAKAAGRAADLSGSYEPGKERKLTDVFPPPRQMEFRSSNPDEEMAQKNLADADFKLNDLSVPQLVDALTDPADHLTVDQIHAMQFVAENNFHSLIAKLPEKVTRIESLKPEGREKNQMREAILTGLENALKDFNYLAGLRISYVKLMGAHPKDRDIRFEKHLNMLKKSKVLDTKVKQASLLGEVIWRLPPKDSDSDRASTLPSSVSSTSVSSDDDE